MIRFKFFIVCLLAVSPIEAAVDIKADNSVLIIKEALNNNWGWPGLHYAINNFSQEEADLIYSLKEEDANILTPEITLIGRTDYLSDKSDDEFIAGHEEGYTPLELALRSDMPDLALKMIENGVEFNFQRKDFKSCYKSREAVYGKWVRYNSRYAEFEGVHKKIGSWAQWELKYDIYTPLYWAIKGGHEQVVRALLERSVNLSDTFTDHFEHFQDVALKQYGAVETAGLFEQEGILRMLLRAQAKRFAGVDITEESISQNDIAVFMKYARKDTGKSFLLQAIIDGEFEDFSVMLAYGIVRYPDSDNFNKLLDAALKSTDEQFLIALYYHMQQAHI